MGFQPSERVSALSRKISMISDTKRGRREEKEKNAKKEKRKAPPSVGLCLQASRGEHQQ